MKTGKLRPLGKLNFPGFQRILDFTSAGSEASVSVAVDGDTDKEYIICARPLNNADSLKWKINNDDSNMGEQLLYNAAGTIGAAQRTGTNVGYITSQNSFSNVNLLTPTGFIKTWYKHENRFSNTSGTTVARLDLQGGVWNSTANVTSLDFYASGNFTAGTRVIVFARRSNV